MGQNTAAATAVKVRVPRATNSTGNVWVLAPMRKYRDSTNDMAAIKISWP